MLVRHSSMATAGLARAPERRRAMAASRRTWEVAFAGIFALAAGMLTLMVAAPSAQAEERVCRGTIGATTVDNLRVPTGATCSLSGTQVKGTVKVERGANRIRVKAISRARASGTSASTTTPPSEAACS